MKQIIVIFWAIYNHSQKFLKKGKHLCRGLFLISLQPATFSERDFEPGGIF